MPICFKCNRQVNETVKAADRQFCVPCFSRLGEDLKCDLCGTEESDGYSDVFQLGTVCRRCVLLDMGGPEMMFMPHCPKPPSDIDPEVLLIQMQGMEPLTEEEYDAWAKSNGNTAISGKDKVRQIFARKKLENWFSENGNDDGEIQTALAIDPVSYQLLEACACKVPPTEMEIPGIDIETAKAMIKMFRYQIFTGDIISKLAATDISDSNETCGNCGKEESESSPLLKCARCKKMKYCSKSCQVNHWRQHKQRCEPA